MMIRISDGAPTKHVHEAEIRAMVRKIAERALAVDYYATLAREDLGESLNSALGSLLVLQGEVDRLKAMVDATLMLASDR